jgi:hypothetical protein
MIPNNKLMRFRKLRIAWSILCGIACLLLIVLWIRSYSSADVFDFQISRTRLLGFGSVQGGMFAYTSDYMSEYYQGPWEMRGEEIVDPRKVNFSIERYPQYRGILGFGFLNATPTRMVCAPHWFSVCVTCVFADLPWLKRRWNFTLRTLLNATTLVAVVLGLIVYAAGQ